MSAVTRSCAGNAAGSGVERHWTAPSTAPRPFTAPAADDDTNNENAPDLSGLGRFGNLEHETGLEAATPALLHLGSDS